MKKHVIAVSILVLISSALCAQATVPDAVFRQADSIVTRNAIPELNSLLEGNKTNFWYPKLEAFLLKRARQLVIEDDLDKAKAVCLSLVDSNLDNKEAVELYRTIQDAMKKHDAEKKKADDAAALAAFKQKTAEDKIKQDLSKNYKSVTNTTSGKTVYLDQDFNNQYRSYSWDILLGLANVNSFLNAGENSMKYGLSGSGSVFFRGEGLAGGAEISGDGMLMTFTGAQALNWSAGLVGSVSKTNLNKYVTVRGGLKAFGFNFGSTSADSTIFVTPVVGLGLHDIKVGSTGRLQWVVDYYLGHLMVDNMTVALGTQLLTSFVLADMQDFDILFSTGIKDSVFVYSSSVRNDAKLVLSLGVGNYE
jgi:hypothetical protein